jgi:hypothetical protein
LICPICSLPINCDPDLHEALIPRSAIQGAPKEIRELIYDKCNCVLRHHICPDGHHHTGGVGGDEIFELCLKDIVKWEGKEAVEEYLKMMETVTVTAGKFTLTRYYMLYPKE